MFERGFGVAQQHIGIDVGAIGPRNRFRDRVDIHLFEQCSIGEEWLEHWTPKERAQVDLSYGPVGQLNAHGETRKWCNRPDSSHHQPPHGNGAILPGASWRIALSQAASRSPRCRRVHARTSFVARGNDPAIVSI
jgi:hypothetical protein